MDRKEFLKNASAATVLAMFGISLESCSSSDDSPIPPNNQNPSADPIIIDLDDAAFRSLQTDREWLLHPGEDILLVNVGGIISAFSSVCTHTGCTRNWDFFDEFCECTCHGSQFSTAGSVLQGPANAPLTRKTVSRSGNIITIT